MPEAETSARFALPYLNAGQAQKEVTHNEALTLIDLALHPIVEAVGLNSPPIAPIFGQAWIVGTQPTASWSGAAGALAGWTCGGWRFVQLPDGSSVASQSGGQRWRRESTTWLPSPKVTAPIGGAIIDDQCRTALSTLIGALISHGLIEQG